jgi:predicted transcriptional regulator
MRNYNLELSGEIDDKLSQIAARNHITRSEAVIRAFELLAIFDDAKENDSASYPAIIRRIRDDDWEIVVRITGYD